MSATRTSPALKAVVAASVVGMIAMNVLANALPFFGRGTGEVSARYPTLVTPAGYVFAIWGLIYIALLAYSVGQFLPPLSNGALPQRLAWPIIVSNVANVTWLLLWHSLQIYLSVLVMLVLLGSLIAAYLIARRDDDLGESAPVRWTVRAPLGLYLGWVSVATIANISGALVDAKWNGWGVPADAWGVIVLVVAAALALTGLAREGDLVFAGVFVWALIGIAVATASPLVRVAGAVLATVIALGMAVSAWRRHRWV